MSGNADTDPETIADTKTAGSECKYLGDPGDSPTEVNADTGSSSAESSEIAGRQSTGIYHW